MQKTAEQGKSAAGGGVQISRDAARVRRGFWTKIRRTMGRVPFTREAVAAYYCAFDPQTPLRVKGILLAALAYFVMPVDLVPDFIAGFGFTDDAAVFLTAWHAVASHVASRHHARAAVFLDDQSDHPGATN